MGASGLTVDIVTGFLGSGKTTLLKQVLSRGMGDRKVAVIVNEDGGVKAIRHIPNAFSVAPW